MIEQPESVLWALRATSLRSLLRLILVAFPFLVAGTVHWPRGWIGGGIVGLTGVTAILVTRVKNPGLFKARRENVRPTRGFDQLFTLLYVFSMAAFVVLSALPFRLGRPPLSIGWLYAGIALHVIGSVPFIAALATNPFLETTVRIQNDRGHFVIVSGPYAIVRHPMYAGLMVLYPAWALIIGSRWALIPAAVIALLFIFRAEKEDRVLGRELPGYREYAARTRYRLVPGVW